jgi:hypothetical protein
MTRTALSTLFVVILFVSSGCSALDLGLQTDKVSVTPAPVPTDTPVSQSTPQRMPCLTDSPIVNISSLVSTHNETLWNTSFTVRETFTAVSRNGSLRTHSVFITRVAGEYSRIHIIQMELDSRGSYSQTRHEIWTNGNQGASRTISGHTVQYDAFTPAEGQFSSYALYHTNEPIEKLRNGTGCVIDQFTRNESAIYLVQFTIPINANPNTTHSQNATGRAFIDSRGVVRELGYHYTTKTTDGVVFNVTKKYRITNIGSTTVDRPVWYGMAMNRTQPQTNRTQHRITEHEERFLDRLG